MELWTVFPKSKNRYAGIAGRTAQYPHSATVVLTRELCAYQWKTR